MARPAQTSQAAFIKAALEFIDEFGVDDLSLRSLGKQMDISHAALYRHFANKDELINALIDDQLGEAISDADLSLGPKLRLRNLAIQIRNHFDQHPNLLKPWINGTGQGKNAFVTSQITLDGLRELGISEERLAHWLRVLENFVLGSMVYDYAAAPAHLEIRANRLNFLHDYGFFNKPMTPESVGKQNLEAFEAALDILLDAVEKEGQQNNAQN